MRVTESWEVGNLISEINTSEVLLVKKTVPALRRHWLWFTAQVNNRTNAGDNWYLAAVLRLTLNGQPVGELPFALGNIPTGTLKPLLPCLPTGGALPALVFRDNTMAADAQSSCEVPGFSIEGLLFDCVELSRTKYSATAAMTYLYGFRLISFPDAP